MRKFFSLTVFISIFAFLMPLMNSNANAVSPPMDKEPLISMDFKDAALKDILKAFSIQSGLNFIASEAVQDRKITLYLADVPLDRAMDLLFKANNLSYELDKESNILIVKDWGKLSIETVTKVFYLKYATVSSSSLKQEMGTQINSTNDFITPTITSGGSNVNTTTTSTTTSSTTSSSTGKWASESDVGITNAVKKLLSNIGSVIEDYRTNSLIVTDTPKRIAVIAQVIASLDIPVPQVLLEVEMLDVNKNRVDQLGVNWPQTPLSLDMSNAVRVINPFGKFGTGGQSQTLTPYSNTTLTSPTVQAWSGSHFGPVLFGVGNGTISLDLLTSLTDTKILARPKLLTLNNETAEISIATDEAIDINYTNSSIYGGFSSTSVDRAPTGVILRVTPQINTETGEITMFIYPRVADTVASNLTASINGIVQTFKDPEERATKSIVRMKDGETVVLGGLIRNNIVRTTTRVPFFSDIPLLGALFRHQGSPSDQNSQRELLVFITPHIIKDNPSEIKLVHSSNIAIPEREQNLASGFSRETAIGEALNAFDRKPR